MYITRHGKSIKKKNVSGPLHTESETEKALLKCQLYGIYFLRTYFMHKLHMIGQRKMLF